MSKKSRSNYFLSAAIVALSIGFVGCGNQAQKTSFTQTKRVNINLPQVVATTSVLCDLTKQVAGKTINLTCLIPPGKDPHLYEPTPLDSQAIERANLILYNGYNFEPGLIEIIKSTKSSAPKIAVGQLAVPKPQQFQQNGKRVIDPHLWHDAKNAIRMVDVINSNLGKLAPSNAKAYNGKAKKIKNELTKLDSWVKARIATIPSNQSKLVTSHDGLGYYANAYGISLAGSLQGISTEQKPTDRRIKNLVIDIEQTKVPTIFAENIVNPKLIQSVAKQANVKVSQRELYVDGIGEPGSEGGTYQKMMVSNTRTIVEGLGGTYLIFAPRQK
ncbi:MAG: zinc ABC transporter substrate-binding protein [Gloeotrichia echinulata IR180]|jgi:ABC-type Zn uptake system ZnuABC Zn-binding protein ZnuA|nr:zinc ABC transporter substrate-binding protein [Gloeotrichia echinulata DEX184]